MKRLLTTLIAMLPVFLAGTAAATTEIVTTTPGLASLAREVGGEFVRVESLASFNEDPHYVDGRPSFILKLRRASLLVQNGLELEIGWLPPLLLNARNGDIQPGKPGNLDASRYAGPLLGIPSGPVDRRMGDIHPGGNPHFIYNPDYGLRIASAIAERLSQIDAEHARNYQANLALFREKLAAFSAGALKRMSAYRGKAVVCYHDSLRYLTYWLGLTESGYIEPLPGVSPSPSHLAGLITAMRERNTALVITEPWHDLKTAEIVAAKAGVSVAVIPGDVGAAGTTTYIEFLEKLVQVLETGFSRKNSN